MAVGPENPDSHGTRTSWKALAARLALLAGFVGVAGLVAWVLNEKQIGKAGSELAIFSAITCGFSAGAALFLVGLTTGTQRAFAGLLISILFRTLGPLAAGLYWRLTRPDWPIDNLIAVHVPLFLVALTVETILVVDIVSTSSQTGLLLGKGRATRKMHG